MLTVLRLADDAPAWHSNRLKRLTSMPKRYLTDSGLAAWLMGADRQSLKRDSDARGRIIDTYVAAQLRAEVEVSAGRVQMFHMRTQGGEHEIDLVVEFRAPAGGLRGQDIERAGPPATPATSPGCATSSHQTASPEAWCSTPAVTATGSATK